MHCFYLFITSYGMNDFSYSNKLTVVYSISEWSNSINFSSGIKSPIFFILHTAESLIDAFVYRNILLPALPQIPENCGTLDLLLLSQVAHFLPIFFSLLGSIDLFSPLQCLSCLLFNKHWSLLLIFFSLRITLLMSTTFCELTSYSAYFINNEYLVRIDLMFTFYCIK